MHRQVLECYQGQQTHAAAFLLQIYFAQDAYAISCSWLSMHSAVKQQRPALPRTSLAAYIGVEPDSCGCERHGSQDGSCCPVLKEVGIAGYPFLFFSVLFFSCLFFSFLLSIFCLSGYDKLPANDEASVAQGEGPLPAQHHLQGLIP